MSATQGRALITVKRGAAGESESAYPEYQPPPIGRGAARRHTVGMQIFLVEDSVPVRARLAAMLDGIPGATLIGEAADADAAIRDILAARPDIVVLDLGLAGSTSGFDVLRAVRLQAPEIDFYMLSNHAAEPYRQLAERLGARQFFDKSCEFDVVRAVIAQRAAGKQ